MPDLFDQLNDGERRHEPREQLAPGAMVLRGRALGVESAILSALEDVLAHSPFRNMVTPGGHVMSVAMTNCGQAGWVTDRSGYRYTAIDPGSGRPWPAMPAAFAELAAGAASDAGFAGFVPDACLINRYEPGAKLSLHQDRDERDLDAPIVSVSLGVPAVFLWGGLERSERPRRIPLWHGDVVVWGGPSRLVYHGVLPVKDAVHESQGRRRINLTFRKAR